MILNPLYHASEWVIIISYFILLIAIISGPARLFPLVIKIDGDKVIFWSVPWKFTLKRDWLDEVVFNAVSIQFLPKKEYADKFKWIPKISSGGECDGYRILGILNYEAIGALIDAMQPITSVDINWDKLSPKWREYFLKKMYDSKKDRLMEDNN